ncbi:lytic murein transglycosylase [Shimia sp. SDUM112013]|uniref:lytic murein transglycosylase n=1 Tax=Shimia sp. SDUM112013 TaxID=3136160 RepID=UPI0032EE7C5A
MLRLLLLLCLLTAPPALAQSKAAVEKQFRQWLEQDLWPAARAAGVSRQTFNAAFDEVSLNWKLPDLVPPGSSGGVERQQRQAEFGSPAKYFSAGAIQGATRIGKDMARRHAKALARTERKTGVPGRIILGIWGRESGYGRAKIPHDAFEVLGTKAFMSTRAPYFTEQTLAALQMSQRRMGPPGRLKSSWAGALGQPQFMPSNVLAFAVDGDGDGRADIWNSEADTIASIGNYLTRHGWERGRDWGFEVMVPAAVSCTLEGPDQGRRISQWAAMGVTRVSGKPFPKAERNKQGFLLMPAGRGGPAFIVTQNFYVLKEYNKSDLYALFVGHVGDRIQYNMGNFSRGWDPVGGLYRSDVARMQRALERKGHDVGGADGLPGFKTRRSIGRWQESRSNAATCFPTKAMKAALR